MKKLIVVAIAIAGMVAVQAVDPDRDATFTFSNLPSDVTGFGTNIDGTRLAAADGSFWAQAAVQTETDGAFTPFGTPSPFVANGIFSLAPGGGSDLLVLSGVPAGTEVNVVVQAWDGAGGITSYADASIRGESEVFAVVTGNDATGGTPSLPPNITGFTGVMLVPEPSTIALGLLGAGLLLMRRRK
jgi:hypothetical protein